jgi:hypothetical protein
MSCDAIAVILVGFNVLIPALSLAASAREIDRSATGLDDPL